jgi:hypothetical protein
MPLAEQPPRRAPRKRADNQSGTLRQGNGSDDHQQTHFPRRRLTRGVSSALVFKPKYCCSMSRGAGWTGSFATSAGTARYPSQRRCHFHTRDPLNRPSPSRTAQYPAERLFGAREMIKLCAYSYLGLGNYSKISAPPPRARLEQSVAAADWLLHRQRWPKILR